MMLSAALLALQVGPDLVIEQRRVLRAGRHEFQARRAPHLGDLRRALHFRRQELLAADDPVARRAAWMSVPIPAIATVISTLLAMATALATARSAPFRGMTARYVIINFPLMAPESSAPSPRYSLVALFAIERGFMTIALAHVAFGGPFAYMRLAAA